MRAVAALALVVFILASGAARGQSADTGVYRFNDQSADFAQNYETGQQIILRVCYANTGTAPAANVAHSMQLPTGLSDVKVSSMMAPTIGISGSYDATTGVLSFANLPDALPAGAIVCGPYPVFVPIVVTFTPPAGPGFAATARVTTTSAQIPNTLPDAVTGTFTRTNTTPTLTDLVMLIQGPVRVPPGVPVEYSFRVRNNGPRDATGVVLHVQLPLGANVVTPVPGGSYDPTAGLLTFPTTNALLSGGEQVFAFSIIDPPALRAFAALSSDNAEPDYSNNVASFDLTPAGAAPVPLLGPASLAALAFALFLAGWAAIRRHALLPPRR